MATYAFVGIVLGIVSAIFSVVLGEIFLGLAKYNSAAIVNVGVFLLALIYAAISLAAGYLFDRVVIFLRQRKGTDA